MFNDTRHNNLSHVIFGRSFDTCDRPGNQSCVLSDEYCHGNETDYGNATVSACCMVSNTSSDDSTWYYLHLSGAENVSEISLEFEGGGWLNGTVPPCDNVSISIEPFGTVPLRGEDGMSGQIADKDHAVRVDTFEISGTKLQLGI